ncbi:HAD family hydrolase, partial [Streptomyces sp. NPDC087850]
MTDSVHVRELLSAARCVLFDFDGPVARLYAGHPAAEVADRLRSRLGPQPGRGPGAGLSAGMVSTRDPFVLLRGFAELEAALTAEELTAARSAKPTLGAAPLIRRLVALDRRLAVTTNNSAEAARRYLEDRGLIRCFGRHIYGRTADVTLLKPHPDSLLRALDGLGASASEALMIGDGASDAKAAAHAGVAFLGYARNGRKL